MGAILKLLAVAAVVGVFALDSRVEFALCGSALLVIVAAVIRRIDNRVTADAVTTAKIDPTQTTMPVKAWSDLGDGGEGRTVPARLSPVDAAQMHERYAPAFDQQLAIRRHQERFGEDCFSEDDDPTSTFDQQRYEQAQLYAKLFDEQLSSHRRTAAYEVPKPLARGSYTEDQYVSEAGYTPQPSAMPAQPAGWDPQKSPSVTGMRRVK